MGRLSKRYRKFGTKTGFIFLFIIATIVFFYLYIQRLSSEDFKEYLTRNTLKVGSQVVQGKGQIYYEYKGKRTYVTNNKNNHISPEADGKYIVWMDEKDGSYQIVRYNILNKTRLQLTTVGNNTSPMLDGGKVVWQGLSQEWAVYYFDGIQTKKISQQFPAIRPYIRGTNILYAQQVDAQRDRWQTIEYDTATATSRLVIEGSAADASWPRFEGNQIKAGLEGSAAYY